MSYYKTNDPAVLTAWEKYTADRKALQAKVDAFSARFRGEGLLYRHPASFAGIKFPNYTVSKALWRNPDSNGLQRPRKNPLPGAGAETKRALKALNADWDENAPKDSISMHPVFQAMGHCNSLDFIIGGISLFVHDGWLYAETGSVKTPKLTEILGSEWEAAREAHRRS